MKKLISLLLCAAALFSLAACDASRCRTPGNFYYRKTDPSYGSSEGLIAPEIRELCSYEENFPEILDGYFAGPDSRSLESPFPRDVHVVSWDLTEEMLSLNLSESFAALSGVDLSVACSCIARTFLELLPVERVCIEAESKLLNGQNAIVLTRDNMSFADDSLAQLKTTYTLYYTDRKMRYLIGVDTSASLASQEDVIRFLVQQLMSTPYNSDLMAPIPFGTKLLDVSVKGGLCTLNFSSNFESKAWPKPEAQRTTLLSIVNTLTQVEGITQVEFCTEGNLLVQYGSLNISAPFVPEEQAIGPIRSGINEFDTTIYLSNGSDQYLTGIPLKIRQTAGSLQEELILKTLIAYKPLNGFYSIVPAGTKINSIRTEFGICYIDLSREFLSDPDRLTLAVHSIVASVCAVKDIDCVRITVDGKVPANLESSLFQVLSPKPDWFI